MRIIKYKFNNKSRAKIPKHVAIIMDGNGRWAKKRGKLRVNGHKAGIIALKKAIRFAIYKNIQSLTIYAFSSENWNRPKVEVESLIELLIWFLDYEIRNLNIKNIKLTIIGDLTKFDLFLQDRIRNAVDLTRNNTGLHLNVAISYGGRWDITQGIKLIAKKIKDGTLLPENINENIVNKFFSLHDQATIDLVIRTGKEYRISNFLLWQIAYSELYFTDILWPDFNEKIFENAIFAFSKRNRRFGRIDF